MTNNLDKIEHIVVLMLENRSFDNMLGWLYDSGNNPPFNKVPAGQSFNGVSGKNLSNPIPDHADKTGAPGPNILVGKSKTPTDPNPDPGEEYEHVYTQMFNTALKPEGCWQCLLQYVGLAKHRWPDVIPMSGFITDYVNNFTRLDKKPPTYEQYSIIMNCCTPDLVPVISQLAHSYAVCDNWHCSVPSQTFCNRSFAHAATSHGFTTNSPMVKWFFYHAPTIFDRIQAANRPDLSWKVYFDELDVISLTRMIHPTLWRYHDSHFFHMDTFEEDAQNGTLPSYAFIEPRLLLDHNDQHPPIEDPLITSSVAAGELLINQVYQAIRNGKKWEQTLLIITYDEHGGCYDHAPPPTAVPPHPHAFPGQDGFTFDHLGIRVPAVIISPYVEAGTVIHTLFDHTSIIKTITNRWDLPPLTERDKQANDLSSVFTRSQPRTDFPEITPKPYTPPEESSQEPLNELQRAILVVATGLVQIDRIREDQPTEAKIEDLMRLIRDESEVFQLKTVGEGVDYLTKVLQPDK